MRQPSPILGAEEVTMTVTATTPTTTATTTSSAAANAKAATVDYNSFLKLLVEQLKDQDPTQPTDPTAYLSQLAAFSNVEQGVQTNAKLDSLLTTNSLTQAENVIGKTVSSFDGTTSGKVIAVSLGSDGTTTALLDSGSTLTLGSGVVVSGATASHS